MAKTVPEVVEKFMRYVRVDTQSAYVDPSGPMKHPTTEKQLNLARMLAQELKDMGAADVEIDDYGVTWGTLPANVEGAPIIGFCAHIDTTPEVCGTDVKPRLWENYDGGDLVLNQDRNIVFSPREYPELLEYVGQSLVTSDGTTLLGADCKAGVADIMTAFEYLAAHPEIPHGTLRAFFTPDEEVGCYGVDNIDLKKHPMDFAFTLDCGHLGQITYETFNGATANITVKGHNVHPGLAKNEMVNSIEVIEEFNAMLPKAQKPEYTEKREGYFHVLKIAGDVEKTEEAIYVRDHDFARFEERKRLVADAARYMNEKYGAGVVTVDLSDTYFNIANSMKNDMHIVETMKSVIRGIGAEPEIVPLRGGTDGTKLSAMGVPTPNLFAGGNLVHSIHEFVSVDTMEKSVEAVIGIARAYGEKHR